MRTSSHPLCLLNARKKIARAAEKAGLRIDAVRELEIAAGEVLSNINRHAYPDETGPVFIEVFRTQRVLGLIVVDHGRATAPAAVPASPPPHEQIGGRGLYVMSRLLDRLDIRVNVNGHGLAILMTKSYGRQTAAA